MERAVYPYRTCREAVFGELGQAGACDVQLYHPGPCASLAIPDSLKVRDAWEEAHPAWKESIGSSDIIL